MNRISTIFCFSSWLFGSSSMIWHCPNVSLHLPWLHQSGDIVLELRHGSKIGRKQHSFFYCRVIRTQLMVYVVPVMCHVDTGVTTATLLPLAVSAFLRCPLLALTTWFPSCDTHRAGLQDFFCTKELMLLLPFTHNECRSSVLCSDVEEMPSSYLC